MFFWKARFDASGKHSDLLVVAGYLSNRLNWKVFNQAWKVPLTRNEHTDIFHAADFESNQGDFSEKKGWTRDRITETRLHLIDALLGANLHMGVACCVPINDYEKTIPRWVREQKGLGTAYEFAVTVCMSQVAKWCQHNRQPDPVSYVVEHGEGKEGKIQDSFKAAFADERKRNFFRLGKLIFDTKEGAVGLQAADMLANYMWNEKIGIRPPIEPYSRITHAPNLQSLYFDKKSIEQLLEMDRRGRQTPTPEGTIYTKTPDPVDIEVSADFSEAENILAELETLAETFPERVYSLIKHPSSVEKLFRVKAENVVASGSGANELRISFKPNDRALSSVSALRASHTNSDLSEGKVSH